MSSLCRFATRELTSVFQDPRRERRMLCQGTLIGLIVVLLTAAQAVAPSQNGQQATVMDQPLRFVAEARQSYQTINDYRKTSYGQKT